MARGKIADILLRLAVAFAFFYPPVDALVDPTSWVGYLPKFVHGLVPDLVVLHSFGLVEAVIALWILSGRRIFIPSLLAALILAVIVLLNLQDFQVLFRDVALLLAALSLAIVYMPSKQTESITSYS